jgi:hypothetical protein
MVVLISDFYTLNEDCQRHLNRLRSHNDILAYHICDPLELAPPKPQIYAVSNGKRELLWDTRQQDIALDYEHYCQQRIAAVKEQCRQGQIQYVQVTPDLDLAQLVRQTFPRRKHG